LNRSLGLRCRKCGQRWVVRYTCRSDNKWVIGKRNSYLYRLSSCVSNVYYRNKATYNLTCLVVNTILALYFESTAVVANYMGRKRLRNYQHILWPLSVCRLMLHSPAFDAVRRNNQVTGFCVVGVFIIPL
jgi:hypothetical protein